MNMNEMYYSYYVCSRGGGLLSEVRIGGAARTVARDEGEHALRTIEDGADGGDADGLRVVVILRDACPNKYKCAGMRA